MQEEEKPIVGAAIDLGSNTFHLLVAEISNHHLQVLDRLRDRVCLAAGMNERRYITQETQDRALECLEKFAQRVREFPIDRVRAVGTNALRQARNRRQFLRKAEVVLGRPIEIISGYEEARLIYAGVAHGIAPDENPRLVIDIGGGSTEAIVGKGYQPKVVESFAMGCVSTSLKYFADGVISTRAMRRAVTAAGLEVQPLVAEIQKAQWQTAIGASGTVQAIGDVLKANGWCTEGITYKGLKQLKNRLVELGQLTPGSLPGLSDDRLNAFVGGFAVLYGVFKSFRIRQMQIADGGVREGLLYDMLGRSQHRDIRNAAIFGVLDRYAVDKDQATRVENEAMRLYATLKHVWAIDSLEYENLLRWAARLHELGLVISHSRYHRHSAYMIEHMDLAGFSRETQYILATMVGVHRRKFSVKKFNVLPSDLCRAVTRLGILLRLAVLLNRSRFEHAELHYEVETEKRVIRMRFASEWLASHPMTEADLAREQLYLSAAEWELHYESVSTNSELPST